MAPHLSRFRTAIAAGLLFSVIAGLTTTADASAGSGATNIVVSSPAEPISIRPGATASTSITVGNVGTDPVDLRVTPAQVKLLNGGSTRFVAGRSGPDFGMSIEPSKIHLAGRSQQSVTIDVSAPSKLVPNDYFLGFLVTPIVHSQSVTVINQVGALVVLDVPGSRDERLTASYVGLPSFALWGSADGSIRVKSVGRSTVRFTTDTELTGFPSPRPAVRVQPPQLLPPGLVRDEPVHLSTWLGIGWATLHTTLVYNLTDQRTGQVTLSKTVFLVSPIWFVVPVAMIALGIGLVLRRQRRRHAAAARARVPQGQLRRRPTSDLVSSRRG